MKDINLAPHNTKRPFSSPHHSSLRISVVIPTCDRFDMLLDAIASVGMQSIQAFEVIVVDNGRQAVNPSLLADSTRLVRTEPRIGASKARNIGVQQAQGDYVAFLDDDDRWDAHYLEFMRNSILSHPVPPHCLLGRRDILIDGVQRPRWCVRKMSDLLPDVLFRNPGLGGQSMVVEREAYLRLGGFDVDLITAEDRALVLEFILNGYVVKCVPDAIAILTEHDGPRLTNVEPMLTGKERFISKYTQLMGPYEKLRNMLILLQLRMARRNAPRLFILMISVLSRLAVVVKWLLPSPWTRRIKLS